ncbi:hypothetical protein [Glycocaulis sp.]|uniref:hypothetical protein n=1 Tax=Glycocaulis sp. TaxID=1969725 RepID=UPI003D1B0E29
MAESTQKTCFVISPIGEEGSETRKRADQVLKHIIKPALLECGYHAERADEIDKPGLITSQVITRVVNDPLVIADLTETNPNVFYELAIRHAIKRPLIQLIQKGEQIPFDVAGTRTIHIDHRDLDAASVARDSIKKQVQALEADPTDIETPISLALDIQSLRQSDNPDDRNIADLIEAMTSLRSTVLKIGENTVGRDDIINIVERMVNSDLYRKKGIGQQSRDSFHHFERTLSSIMHAEEDWDGAPMALLVIASALRDDLPWLADTFTEAYRQLVYGTSRQAQQAIQQIERVIRSKEFNRLENHPVLSRYPIYPLVERMLMHVSAQARRSS